MDKIAEQPAVLILQAARHLEGLEQRELGSARLLDGALAGRE